MVEFIGSPDKGYEKCYNKHDNYKQKYRSYEGILNELIKKL